MIRIQHQVPLTAAFDRFFTDLLDFEQRPQKTSTVFGNAPLNIQEAEHEFVIQVIAPGHEKKNFSVAVENEMLVIEAKVKEAEKTHDMKALRTDYAVSDFKKVVHLDRKVVGDPADATYENGILRIVLPKLKEEINQRMQVKIN